MSVTTGHLLADLPATGGDEAIALLMDRPGARIERIVSRGHTSPDGFWYDQTDDEWVLVVQGQAAVQILGEAHARELSAGDYLLIPAHVRHRVTATGADPATVWLAVHFPPTR